MRFPQIALLLVAILYVPAAAQQSPNPVTQHYHAYREALVRGDLEAADTEVSAALAASRARDGNGGNTSALALDTAFVRLGAGHREAALEPAQLAASLAANPQAGIDPLVVDVALKRALLRPGDQSESQLLEVLTAAKARGGLDEYVYDGGADLGAWASHEDHQPVALAAWRLASQASPGDSDAAVISRAEALIETGVAMFRIETHTNRAIPPGQSIRLPLQSGNGVSFRPSVDVYTVLAEATRITRPIARHPSPDGSLTRAQLLHSRALAFYSAEWSRLAASHVDTSSIDGAFGYLALPSHAGATPCIMMAVAEPMPTFPSRERNAEHVGAVVVRLLIDGAGHVTGASVVATVGGDAFERSVASVLSRWTVAKYHTSPPNCDMAMTLFTPITFRFDD